MTNATDLSVNITDKAVANDTEIEKEGPNNEWWEDVANAFIEQYIYPVLCLIGFSGNFLTILILSRKRNRKDSTAVFLIILAVSDTIVLFEGYFCTVISNILHIDFLAINDISCKIHMFLTYFSLQCSSWILVLVTIERVVSVVKPYRARIICSRKTAMTSLTITGVILAVLNGHLIYGTIHAHHPNFVQNCTLIPGEYMEFAFNVWTKIDFALTFALPCLFIVTGNGIIIFKTRERSKVRKYIVASDLRNSSVTAMLLLLSMVFIVCTGPGAIYIPLVFPKILKTYGSRQIPVHIFLYGLFNCLAGLNASVNFLLYFLSGSKFRTEVKTFFTCRNSPRSNVFAMAQNNHVINS